VKEARKIGKFTVQQSPACPGPSYFHIGHSLEGSTLFAPELNYIMDIVLKLKAELAKIRLGKWVNRIRYGSNRSSVRVNFRSNAFGSGSGLGSSLVTFESVMFGSGLCLVRIEFGSGMFRVVYGSLVMIGYRTGLIWVGWHLLQCSGECQVACKSC